MKRKQYHSVGTIPESNIKIVESAEIDTPNTQIYDRSISLLATGTSIKSDGVKLVLWVLFSELAENVEPAVYK